MGKIIKKESQEIILLDETARNVITYSEDDRRKADSLYKYYQTLIEQGDKKGETREGLARALQLREESVKNLIEIIKIKARIIEKKIMLEAKQINNNTGLKPAGFDNSDLISEIEGT